MSALEGAGSGSMDAGTEGEFVIEMKTYADGKGRQIQKHVLISGALPEGYAVYRGMAVLNIQAPDGTAQQQQFVFPIFVKSLQEAFAAFEAESKKYADEIIQKAELQMRRQQILRPGVAGWRGKVR